MERKKKKNVYASERILCNVASVKREWENRKEKNMQRHIHVYTTKSA